LSSAGAFDLQAPYHLGDHVVLRHEPFGALAYDLTDQRLLVLRDPALVTVLERLGEFPSAAAAIAAIAPDKKRAVSRALARLEQGGQIRVA
jgi:putative mycofactocin binding protein MftB